MNEPKEALALRLANTILKEVDIPPPAAWDAAVIAIKFLSRDEALEAAANVAERRSSYYSNTAKIIAAQIRSLKDKP